MSTPRINPNDPKWTAYVLGEPVAEGDAVDQLLESSAEARGLVDELKTACAAIEEALDAEPSPVLTAAQRAAVRRAADAQTPGWLLRLPMRWIWSAGAVAAVLVVAAVLRPAVQQPVVPTRVGQRAASTSVGAASSATGPSVTPPVQTPSTAAPTTDAPAQRPRSARAVATAPPVIAVARPPAAEASARLDSKATRSTLVGAVRDAAGAPLPGATITVVNPATGVASSSVADPTGRYTIANLDPGRVYRVTATLPGFNATSTDVQLAAVSNVQRDFTLSVGSVAETITVSGATPVADAQQQRSLAAARPDSRVAGEARGGRIAPVTSTPVAAPARSAFTTTIGGGVGTFIPTFPTRPRGTESYASVPENAYVRASEQPLATFSIDVDTASYSNVRRFLTQNQMPPADAVRIEELVNYFTYDYPRPSGPHPIATSIAATAAPWNPEHRLVRFGVKARDIDAGRRPPSNLVFLIDVSGSMNTPEKLPLVKSSLKLLVDQLGENDIISIVVYAGASGLVLPPTSGAKKDVIARALDDLQAGGSTNGGAGIQLAYSQATSGFIRGGVNRVILMTDGDFNVGITAQSELTRLIEERAKSGVFLSVLGFGMGNLKDSTMERLADMGNGHYAYVDSLNEARKVLVEQMSGTLVTVAKDVKIQVDFNPAKVEAYRLIGYENRVLQAQDFNDDRKDAGDMGAGHTVTALFEIVPRGGSVPGSVDPSVFQPKPPAPPTPASNSNDMLVLRVRYKQPDASESTRMDVPFVDRGLTFAKADDDFRFAASVAAFGMILKDSPNRGNATLEWVLDTATGSKGKDKDGYRDEFISLVQKAIALSPRR